MSFSWLRLALPRASRTESTLAVAYVSILDGPSGEFRTFEQPRLLLTVDRSGKHHACGRHAVGEQAFDERLQLVDRRQNDLYEEGLSPGDVMAFLHRVKR